MLPLGQPYRPGMNQRRYRIELAWGFGPFFMIKSAKGRARILSGGHVLGSMGIP